MTFVEIRRWAKEKGYKAEKNDNSYSWHRLDNEQICGTTSSVSKLATAIFNNMTDNKFIQHQEDFKNDPRF